MSFPDILTGIIILITVVGSVLGVIATMKIYSKDGFR